MIKENEVHLSEHKDHLQKRSEQNDHIFTFLLQLEANLKEDANFDA